MRKGYVAKIAAVVIGIASISPISGWKNHEMPIGHERYVVSRPIYHIDISIIYIIIYLFIHE